jgi:type II secretory pathway pseudopilin PulG
LENQIVNMINLLTKPAKAKSIRVSEVGFTLIELLVVVSLIIIVVGVTGDIVVSLIRSYSKTQITNEVEQNANFAMNKIEKELRNASQLLSPLTATPSESLSFSQKKANGTLEIVEYTIEDATSLADGTSGVYVLSRSIDGGEKIPVSNYSYPNGVTVVKGTTLFTNTSPAGGPSVINLTIAMRQVGNPSVQFTQTTTLNSTIVIRGTY